LRNLPKVFGATPEGVELGATHRAAHDVFAQTVEAVLTDLDGFRSRLIDTLTRYADADGEEALEETYQVPVSYRRESLESLGHAFIGQCEVPGLDAGPWLAYDALYDKEVTGLWPAGMWADRHGSRMLAAAGMLVSALGLALMTSKEGEEKGKKKGGTDGVQENTRKENEVGKKRRRL